MTRREEITKKALELDTTNDIATFVVAAQWADKTMIEKSCQWIINNMHKYIKAKRLGIFVNNTGMASDFRKAMEE